MKRSSALLIVDVQNDFCPGGSVPVREGDRIVPVLNRYIERFWSRGLPIFASRDWHPPKTSHFAAYGGIWPVHCVAGTDGARFHPELRLPSTASVVSKGMDPQRDDYSAFQAVTDRGDPFPNVLGDLGIRHLYVGGLATDYCVKASVLEGLRRGLSVTLLEDAVRGVDLHAGDSKRAVDDMITAGAEVTTFDALVREEGEREGRA